MVANSLGSDKVDVSSRGSVQSGNCPVGEVSVGDMSVGDVSGMHYAYYDIDVNKSRYTLLDL